MNIWGRIESERHRGNASLSTSFTDADTDTWKMQICVDRALHEGANGNALVGGFTAHYGKANTGVRSFFGDGADLHNIALGNHEDELDIHIASRDDSSSLLPLGEEQKRVFAMEEVSTRSEENKT